MPTIILPPRCDRSVARAVLSDVIAASGAGPIEIDARGCTQIGQAVLQILVSARRTGGGATIQPSAHLRDLARLTGLERELFGENAR